MSYDPEAIIQDGDIEMWELRQAANEGAARKRRSKKLRDDGDLNAAASACPHWAGYGLRGDAARHKSDPRAGEDGDRCSDCNSVVDDLCNCYGAKVIHPCEPKW